MWGTPGKRVQAIGQQTVEIDHCSPLAGCKTEYRRSLSSRASHSARHRSKLVKASNMRRSNAIEGKCREVLQQVSSSRMTRRSSAIPSSSLGFPNRRNLRCSYSVSRLSRQLHPASLPSSYPSKPAGTAARKCRCRFCRAQHGWHGHVCPKRSNNVVVRNCANRWHCGQ
jgi:hypothetical protein